MSIIFLCSPPLYLFDVGDNSVYTPVSKLTNIARFDQDVDRDSNFKHSTVLAMPIKHAGSPGRVLGVFQLVNKFDNLPFTRWLNKFRRGREKVFLALLEGLSRCGQQIWHSQDFISPTPICLILGWLVWLAVTKHKVSAIRSERLYQSYQGHICNVLMDFVQCFFPFQQWRVFCGRVCHILWDGHHQCDELPSRLSSQC